MESLPNELVSMIADLLHDQELISIHSVSTRLRSGSEASFARRFCEDICVAVSLDDLERLERLSRLKRLHASARTLVISTWHVPEVPSERGLLDEIPTTIWLERDDQMRQLRENPDYPAALKTQNWLVESGRFALALSETLEKLRYCSCIQINELKSKEPLISDKDTNSVASESEVTETDYRTPFVDDSLCTNLLILPRSRRFVTNLIAMVLVVAGSCSHKIDRFQVLIEGEFGVLFSDLPPSRRSTDVSRIAAVELQLDWDVTQSTAQARQGLHDFLRNFAGISELNLQFLNSLPSEEFSYISCAICDDENLRDLRLANIKFGPEDLSKLMQQGHWQHLEHLHLNSLDMPGGFGGWLALFQWLETRESLVRIELSMCMSYGQLIYFGPGQLRISITLTRDSRNCWQSRLVSLMKVMRVCQRREDGLASV